ncbi:MAG: transposase [Desulfomonilaceae bacterium]
MRKRNLPQPFQIDKVRFADCFTAPSLQHFGVLITGWVLTVGVHTMSQLILADRLHESESFVSIYRFLQRAKWTPDQVAFKVFRIIVDTLLPGVTEIELVLDDTLNDHVGKKIFGAGFQHNGDALKTGKPIGYGVCFVIIGAVVRLPGISERVFCLPYAARLWWPEKAKVKPLGEKHRSKSELGAELIRLTRSWIGSSITLRVIVDGGYSNRQIIQGRSKGVHITGKVRTDAALYALPTHKTSKRGRPRKKGDRLPCPKSIFTYEGNQWEWVWINLYGQETIVSVHQFEAIWYKAAGNEPLSIVLVRDPGLSTRTRFSSTPILRLPMQRLSRDSAIAGVLRSPIGKPRICSAVQTRSAAARNQSLVPRSWPTGAIASWWSGSSISSTREKISSFPLPPGM